jgi:Serine/threonine protein kinase
MKLFPLYDNNVLPYFTNEIRFAFLHHKNVISIVQYEAHKEVVKDNKVCKFSYILMEFCPYGDFFGLLMDLKIQFEDKLLRTYFHQLIEGIEYLHTHGVAHLDIKPENLLLGEDFQLKIADFDLAFLNGDSYIRSKGTKFHRAPEMIDGTCQQPEAADIFSCGTVLFLLKSGGVLPQTEEICPKGINTYELLQRDNDKFWELHEELKKDHPGFYSKEFKALFNWMTKEDPNERPTILEIKSTEWYNGEIYSNDELEVIMRNYLGI